MCRLFIVVVIALTTWVVQAYRNREDSEVQCKIRVEPVRAFTSPNIAVNNSSIMAM